MRPGTPHVVFTIDHSVCIGGHFLATSTLRDSCYNMMHTFAVGSLTTNTEHQKDGFILLARLVAFYMSEFVGTSNLHFLHQANTQYVTVDDGLIY
jgi:hypothetical protein